MHAAGAPARGAADRGPRGTQKLVRTVPKKDFCGGNLFGKGRVNKPFFGKFINPVLGLLDANHHFASNLEGLLLIWTGASSISNVMSE